MVSRKLNVYFIKKALINDTFVSFDTVKRYTLFIATIPLTMIH